MSLKIVIEPQDSVLIFKLSGKIITENEVYDLESELFPMLGQNYHSLILDLQELTHINSTGIGFMMKSLTKTRVLGGDLILSGLSGNVEKVFEIAKLNEVFTHYNELGDALKHFKTIG